MLHSLPFPGVFLPQGHSIVTIQNTLVESPPMSESHEPRCPMCMSSSLTVVPEPRAGVVPVDRAAATYQCDGCGAIFTLYPPESREPNTEHPA